MTEGYAEREADALAVSGLAEDLRDVVLEYQVGSVPGSCNLLSLKLQHGDR